MAKEKIFLRGGMSHSLFEIAESRGFPLIGRMAHLTHSGADFKRCLSTFQEGKDDFHRRIVDARKVIFNREEMANWLYKIKEEAKTETDGVFIRAEAELGGGKIDFERIGRLAGHYKEADNLLKTMVSIESIDKDKPHFSILDRLEELDQMILDDDRIPSYYRVHTNAKVAKHEFELVNLDHDWSDYLALAHTHAVSTGFGDRSLLLRNYHREFSWAMIKIRPMRRVHLFLNYHLKAFDIGTEQDFLNHIQFRIMPNMDSAAGSNYPIYKQLLSEWLNEKLTGLSVADENFLTMSLLMVLDTFLEDIFENRKRADENKYNMVIGHALGHRISEKNWMVKDQSLGGQTDSASTRNRAGVAFRDLIVVGKIGQHLSAMECFRLRHLPRKQSLANEIASHVRKIFRNEPLGISPLFIVVYYEGKKDFGQAWLTYVDYITDLEFDNYHLIHLEPNVTDFGARANIRVAKALHNRELSTIIVYHIMINMHP